MGNRSSSLRSALRIAGSALVLLAPSIVWSAPAEKAIAQLFSTTVRTGREEQPEITLQVLIPPRNEDSKAEIPILAYCTFENNGGNLTSTLFSKENRFRQYAERHGMAMLTWDTATLWQTGLNMGALSPAARAAQDRVCDAVAAAWQRGVNRLAEAHQLKKTGILIYGFSRGAHWTERLVLRKPENFLAAHIHVANSYDKPTAKGASVLWLVTTGDMDVGKSNARDFYSRCRDLKYPMILKMVRSLGHAESENTNALGLAFFDYALGLQKLAESEQSPGKSLSADAIMNKQLEQPPFIGDLLNEWVYPSAKIDKIPIAQRIPLPSEILAQKWGLLLH